MHTLVSRTVRRYCWDPVRAEKLREAAVRVLTQLLEGAADRPEERRRLAPEVAHTQHLISSGLENPELVRLGLWLARYYHLSASFASARQVWEQVLEASRRLLGAEHPATLAAMNNLAQTLKAQGELGAARELQEQVLKTSPRVLGAKHSNTTIAAWNLWLTLHKVGDHAAAARVYEEYLEWLLERDPSTLSAGQREIREWLSRLRGGG